MAKIQPAAHNKTKSAGMVVTATQILKKLEVDLNTFQIGQNDTFSTQIYKIDIIVGTFSMNMPQLPLN